MKQQAVEFNHRVCKENRADPDLDADLCLHLAALVARPNARLFLSRLVGQRHRSGDRDARMRGGYDYVGLCNSVEHDRLLS